MPFQAVRDSRRPHAPTATYPWRPAPALAGALVACALAVLAAFAGRPALAQAPAVDSTAAATPPAPVAPAPATAVKAEDVPNDGGNSLAVSWVASPDEKAHPERV